MFLSELCDLLDIRKDAQRMIMGIEDQLDFTNLVEELEQMRNPNTWNLLLGNRKAALEPDEDGMKILTYQLRMVCLVYDSYKLLGISEEIFVSTMKFFTRFLHDYMDRHGTYRYQWAWWAVRQISMLEFRIGELEYELRTENESAKKIIDIHIPADADISLNKLRESYVRAREFIAKFYPHYIEAEWSCSSWLLAPTLVQVLPTTSKILQFQKSFIITKVDEESIGFMDWVYGRKDIPIDELPEKTLLQRNLKKYLQNQGKIGWTTGTLIAEPFLNYND
ncbi:MAG: DUF5596 domain-containing protein [Vallitaleaceae bacterium]|nr:DUF5596 domain-containing protein [Vallitaleaceae bacterium]